MPAFFKKMYKVQHEILLVKDVTKAHIELLLILKRDGISTMSSLSKTLFVTKPNITGLVDRLIELNLTERAFDKDDRRVIYVQLTEEGKDFIVNYKESYRKYINKKFVSFTDEDLSLLQTIMDNTKKLLDKIDR